MTDAELRASARAALRVMVAGTLEDHWPDPVFGCDCGAVDEETGRKEILDGAWEQHVAELLLPNLAGES